MKKKSSACTVTPITACAHVSLQKNIRVPCVDVAQPPGASVSDLGSFTSTGLRLALYLVPLH